MENEWIDWQAKRKAQSIKAVLFCYFLLQSYLLISWCTGEATFFWGPRAVMPGLTWKSLCVYYSAFTLALYIAVLAPFLQSDFLGEGASDWRFVFAFLIWAIPLSSFAYWMGDFRGALHAYDLGLFLFAALAIPLILYRRSRSKGALVLGVSLMAFSPLFLMEDILSPFSPLFVYATQSPWVYAYRTLGVAVSILFAVQCPLPRWGKAPEWVAPARFGLVLLSIASALFCLLDWAKTAEAPSPFSPELNWVGYCALIYFVARKDRFGQKAFSLLAIFHSACLTAQAGFLLLNMEASMVSQIHLLLTTLGAGVVLSLLRKRRSIVARAKHPMLQSLEKAPQ
jgi:hypothetical protein